MRATFLILVAALTLIALTLVATTVRGQLLPEIRPFVGGYLPTGSQRGELKDATWFGGQLAVELRRSVHLVGTLAGATPRIVHPTIDPDVHLYQYDLGAEFFRVVPMLGREDDWTWRPFVGAGAGARTHDFYDAQDIDAKPVLAVYGALGAEVQHEQLALRFEARDYVTAFKGLLGNRAATARNDVMLTAGLVLHLR